MFLMDKARSMNKNNAISVKNREGGKWVFAYMDCFPSLLYYNKVN